MLDGVPRLFLDRFGQTDDLIFNTASRVGKGEQAHQRRPGTTIRLGVADFQNFIALGATGRDHFERIADFLAHHGAGNRTGVGDLA